MEKHYDYSYKLGYSGLYPFFVIKYQQWIKGKFLFKSQIRFWR